MAFKKSLFDLEDEIDAENIDRIEQGDLPPEADDDQQDLPEPAPSGGLDAFAQAPALDFSAYGTTVKPPKAAAGGKKKALDFSRFGTPAIPPRAPESAPPLPRARPKEADLFDVPMPQARPASAAQAEPVPIPPSRPVSAPQAEAVPMPPARPPEAPQQPETPSATPLRIDVEVPVKAPAAETDSAPGALSRGFVSGLIESNPQMTAETLEGLSYLAPDELKESLLNGSKELNSLSKLNPDQYKRRSGSMWDIKGFDDALTWAGEAIGQGLASSVPSIITGIGGAAMGSRVGGRTGAVVGGLGGAAVPSAALNYGEVYQELKKELPNPAFIAAFNKDNPTPEDMKAVADGEDKKKRLAAEYALYGAAPMVLLDTLSLGPIITRLGGIQLVKREMARGIAKRIAVEAAKGTGREGITEAVQEMVKDATTSIAADKPFWTEEHAKGWIESGVAGGLTGGVMGAAGGVVPDKATGAAAPGRSSPEEIDAFVKSAGEAPGAPPPPKSAVREQMDEFERRRAAGETYNDKTGEWNPAPATPQSDVSAAPEPAESAPAAAPAQPEPQAPAAPSAVSATERRVLRKKGWKDDQIDAMSRAEADVELGEAADQGIEVGPESESPAPDFSQGGVPAQGAGTRASPAAVNDALDVARAAQNVNTEPTEAQKAAGNYAKGHVRWNGLNITIENPQGSTRTGTDANGQPWQSQMPTAYGYVKRSKGKDGDQVDVYLGPDHTAQTAFVIDQIDPATGKFDEHKVMLGFPDQAAAEQAYDAAFSDGSGARRRTAVTPTTVADFKTWLRTGKTDQPFAAPAPQVADNPSAEPASDIAAQARDLADKKNDRKAVWLPAATVEHLRSVGALDGVLKTGVPMENFDDQGGILIAKDRNIARTARKLKTQKVSMQAIVGGLTGSGTGKPADAQSVVQQRDAAGNVTQESAVSPGEAPTTAAQMQEPGRTVQEIPAEQALAERAGKVTDEQAIAFDEFGGLADPLDAGLLRLSAVPAKASIDIAMGAVNKSYGPPQIVKDLMAAGYVQGTKRALTDTGKARLKAIGDALEERRRDPVAEKIVAVTGGTGGNTEYTLLINGGQLRNPDERSPSRLLQYPVRYIGKNDGGPALTVSNAAMLENPFVKKVAEVAGLTPSVREASDDHSQYHHVIDLGDNENWKQLVDTIGYVRPGAVFEGIRVNIHHDRLSIENARKFLSAIGEEEIPKEESIDVLARSTIGKTQQGDAVNLPYNDEESDTTSPQSRMWAEIVGREDGYLKIDRKGFTVPTDKLRELIANPPGPLPPVGGADFSAQAEPAKREPSAPTAAEVRTEAKPEPKPSDAESGATANAAAKLSKTFADHLREGGDFKNILAARKMAKEAGFGEDAKAVEEALELAVVTLGREIAAGKEDQKAKFRALVDLYSRQPKLGTRTSTSMRDQAFSTPIPLAFVASRLADVNGGKLVFEPTAGNGALLIEAAPENALVNELNTVRAENLRAQGFTVTNADAAEKPKRINVAIDRVIANPPFGAVRQEGESQVFDLSDIQNGYKTKEIDHAIALRALSAMRDDGKAVLLLGGVNKLASSPEARSDAYNGKAKREFFKVLYDRYNVTDHFTTDGSLWERQGAGWPVDVIVIDGRGKSKRALPAVDVPRVLSSWNELGGLIDANAVSGRGNEQAVGAAERPAERGQDRGNVGVRARGERVSKRQSEPGEPGGVQQRPVQRPVDGQSGDQGRGNQVRAERGEPERTGAQPDAERRPSGLDEFDTAFDAALDETFGAQEAPKSSLDDVVPVSSGTGPMANAWVQEGQGPKIPKKRAPRKPKGPSLVDRLENYFRPGRVVSGYGNQQDKVLGFERTEDGYFKVRVQEVKDGKLVGHVRTHMTSPSDRELAAWEKDNPVGSLKQEAAPPAAERTTAEVARSAATNAAESADAAMAGLVQLFGGGKTIGSGPAFDEQTYAKAKPLFEKAAEKFGAFASDIAELVKRMVGEMQRVHGLTREALEAMRPYLRRFIEDVRAGVVNLAGKPKAAEQPVPKPAAKPAPATETTTEQETAHQVAYTPKSAVNSLGTLVPVNMRTAIDESLAHLEERVGPLDEFVAGELGYEVDELGNYFAAEQVDALALAIDNLKHGRGFIIGDQTGIGKGRVNAAIIRWAVRSNQIPVFVTEKPNLYRDMYRDLTDIGGLGFPVEGPLRILATNTGQNIPLSEDNSVTLRTGSATEHGKLLNSIRPQNFFKRFDMVFTTYSQMQTVKGEETTRRAFLGTIAPKAILIFDESHNAGGQGQGAFKTKGPSNRSGFARDLVQEAAGVFYSSATYAKRPDVMDLYSKTDMVLAVEKLDDLAEAISSGGVPMQQVVASMLAKSGQYIRRERSFAGITYDTPIVPADREQYDGMASALAAINDFSLYVKATAKTLDTEIKAQAQAISHDNATGSAGASSVLFTSIMHNIINQMLLAIKAGPVAQMAIDSIKAGQKPIITMANTMESFLSDFAEEIGVEIGQELDIDFGQVLQKYLDRTRTLIIKRPFSKTPVERRYLSDAELGEGGRAAYQSAQNAINAVDLSNLPVSPIDRIKQDIAKAGYSTGEITGRGTVLDYSGLIPVLRRRSTSETSIRGRIQTNVAFNNGDLDAIILNQAGSTGISLHSSRTFKDQKQRHMMIAQPEGNIDVQMQMLGRPNRTGQVNKPTYSQLVADIPAEKRPAAVLAKKMASLNANTTASRGGALTAKDVPDFLNQYGDQIAATILMDDPWLNERLGNPVKFDENGRPEIEDAMRRLTGRIPLLPLTEQEELYQRLEDDYTALLEQLEAAGENALEAKTLDLKAKRLERVEVVPARKGSNSPFAQPVYIEKTSVLRLGKPFSAMELMNEIGERLGATGPMEDVVSEGDATGNAADMLADVNSRDGVWGRIAHRKAQDARAEAIEMFSGFMRKTLDGIDDPAQQDKERTKLNAIKDRWVEIHSLLPIGARVRLKTNSGNVTGIVLGTAHTSKAKNPLALSSWRATFAVSDGTRELSVPFSRLYLDGKSPSDDVTSIELAPMGWDETPAQTLDLFVKMRAEARYVRQIATGNLLRAYEWLNMSGQIINYTDEAGDIRQGILTPNGFDPAERYYSKKRTISQATDVIAWVKNNPGKLLWTRDQALRISLEHGRFFIQTDASKRIGSVYFLDTKLTSLTRDFYKRNGTMVAETFRSTDAELTAIVKRLLELGAVFEDDTKPPPLKTEKIAPESDEPMTSIGDGRRPVISLKGDELGVAFRGPQDMPALRRAAQAWYDANLVGKTATMADGRTVEFNRRGMRESTHGRKGDILLRSIPAIRAIIENGTVVHREAGTRTNVKERLVISAPVELMGKTHRLAVSIHQTMDGTFHYDFTMDREARGPGDGVPGGLTDISPGRSADESTSGNINIFDLGRPDKTAKLTDAAQKRRVEIGNAVVRAVEQVAGPDAAHRTATPDSELFATIGPDWNLRDGNENTISAVYWPRRETSGVNPLIAVAVADNPDAVRSAYHEGWHAIEGTLTPDEVGILEAETERLRAFLKPRLPGISEALDGAEQEEIWAEAAAVYTRLRDFDQSTGGVHIRVRRIFEKIRQIMARIRNALRGLGFQTAEDIFENFAQGEMANRREALPPEWRNRWWKDSEAPRTSIRRRASRPGDLMPLPETVREAWDTTVPFRQRLSDTVDALLLNPARALWDRQIDFLRFQKASELLYGPVPESLDTYLAATLYPGRVGERMKDTVKRLWEPLYDAMKARGIGRDELHDFLYARHAPERNEAIRKIDPANDAGSGMTDDEAATIMASLAPRRADFDAVAALVDNIVVANRDTMRREGLESDVTLRAWENAYNHYVPLKGFESGTDDELPGSPSSGRGFDVRRPESMRALGRFDRADDILTNLLDQTQRTVIRAEKNRVAKTFLRFAQANPSPFYKIGLAEKKRRIDPLTGMVEEYWSNLPTHMDRVFAAKVGGKTHYIEILHSGLLEALKSLGADKMNPFLRVMTRLTREYSRFQTAKNPEFVFTNLLRDLQDAGFSLTGEERDRLLKRYAANILNGKALMGAIFGTTETRAASPHRAWFEEWREAGGKISHYGLKDMEELRREVEREIGQRMESKGKQIAMMPVRMVNPINGKIVKFFEAMAEVTESMTRLAVYISAREVGMTKAQAARLSRNATVDFNRRGKYGSVLGALYAFANANIQGNIRLLRYLRKSKIARRAALGLIVAGMLMTFWNMWASDEDDDKKRAYEKRKYWERERNIFIYLPGSKTAAKIPLGYGLNVFWMIGEQLAMRSLGKVKTGEMIGNILGTMVDAFNPTGSQGSFFDLATWAKGLFPTVLRPIPELALNKNWAGNRIHPDEMPWTEGLPKSSRHKAFTHPAAVGTAEYLNRLTGGTKFEPGTVDLYPDDIEYGWNFAIGGLGRFLANTYGAINDAIDGVERPVERIPFVRRFVASDNSPVVQQGSYYEKRRDEQIKARQLRAAIKARAAGTDTEDADLTIEKLAGELGARPSRNGKGINVPSETIFRAADRDIKALRQQEDAIRKDTSITRAEREQQIRSLREQMREVMGNARAQTTPAN